MSEKNFENLKALAHKCWGIEVSSSFKGRTRDSCYLKELQDALRKKTNYYWNVSYLTSKREYVFESCHQTGEMPMWFHLDPLLTRTGGFKDISTQTIRLLRDVFARLHVYNGLDWVSNSSFFQWQCESEYDEVSYFIEQETKDLTPEEIKEKFDDYDMTLAKREFLKDFLINTNEVKLRYEELKIDTDNIERFCVRPPESYIPPDKEKEIHDLAREGYRWFDYEFNVYNMIYESVCKGRKQTLDELYEDIEDSGCFLKEPEAMIGFALDDNPAEECIYDCCLQESYETVTLCYEWHERLGKELNKNKKLEFFNWLTKFHSAYESIALIS